MADGRTEKICVICGEDCAGRPRTKDPKGRYYCTPCYQRLRESRAAARRAPKPDPVATQDAADEVIPLEPVGPDGAPLGDDLVIPLEEIEQPTPQPVATPDATVPCPSCGVMLASGVKVCVDCGINVESGRSIVTSRGLDENIVHHKAEQVIRWISWVVGVGIYPIASEAMGRRRPYTTWAIAALTVIVSLWFWLSTDDQMNDRKRLLLWSSDRPPSAELILVLADMTDFGDDMALQMQLAQRQMDVEGNLTQREFEQMIVDVHASLPARQQVVDRFRGYQLLTHALLHGDVFHLAGNLLFLLILGSRVNALIGNVATAIVYPILAIFAALPQMIASANSEPIPMLGASGAIMGMAGMYFVLFPINRMFMAAWFRFLFFFRLKVWRMRGFWVLLAFIAFDVFYLSIGTETGTAHWAHVGGFVAGMIVAAAMLLGRVLNAGGGDLLSVVLGRRAWHLIGRPDRNEPLGLHVPHLSPEIRGAAAGEINSAT